MVSPFDVKPTSWDDFWKWSKWPWNMTHSIPCRTPRKLKTLHPSCIHILRWSLKRGLEPTWTGSAFSTNESAWSETVTGSQSRVWSGPYSKQIAHLLYFGSPPLFVSYTWFLHMNFGTLHKGLIEFWVCVPEWWLECTFIPQIYLSWHNNTIWNIFNWFRTPGSDPMFGEIFWA